MQANQEKAQRLHDAGARASEAQTAVELAAKHSDEVASARAAVATASAACQDNAKACSTPSFPHYIVLDLSQHQC